MSKMDDIFKDKLFHHEANVPNDLWSGIEAELLEEDNKKRALYWRVGALSLLLLLLGIVSAPFILSEKNKDKNLAFQADDTSSEITKSIQSTSKPKSHIDKEIITSPHTKSKKIEQGALKKEDSSNTSTNNILHSKIKDSHSSNTANSEFSKIIDSNFEKMHKSNREVTNLAFISRSNQNPSVYGHDKSAISNKASNILHHNADNPLTINQLEKNNLGLIPTSISTLNISKQLKISNFEFIDCPDFNKKKGVPYIGMFYSSDISLKELEINHQFQMEHLNNRLETEKGFYSFTTGLYAGYLTRFNVAIETGAEFSQIMEKFQFEDLKARKTQTVITIDTTFNSNGSYTTSTDTVRIEISGTKEYNITNKYRMINIPISMAYVIKGKRMDVWLRAGAIFNVYFNTLGHILDTNEKPILLESPLSDGGEIFNSFIKPRFRFSVGFNIHLNEFISMNVEPYFTSSTGNISSRNEFIQQSYKNLGMKMGVQYRFEN